MLFLDDAEIHEVLEEAAQALTSRPVFIAIWLIFVLPLATAWIMALYVAGSRTSCFNKLDGSSKR